jgi:hypothetical protein
METQQLIAMVKVFELRVKAHNKNGIHYFNKHQNEKSLICLGRQKEAKFILDKLKSFK